MRLLIILSCCFSFYNGYSQVYTRGGASQLYWDWRPDISDSCYEFTFVTHISSTGSSVAYGNILNLFYWNDCDYGKNYINIAPSGVAIVPPLHDTLFRMTNHFGIVDTFCGFDIPYNGGTSINPCQTNSPHRKEFIYKGLIYLPERCKNWHFAIGNYDYYAPLERIYMLANGNFTVYNNIKSNYDSTYFDRYVGYNKPSSIIYQIHGCSMNNLDFPDNSSTRFTSQPLYYEATNRQVEYNPGPYDPDRDSLVISIPDTLRDALQLVVALGPGGYLGTFFMDTDSAGNPSNDVFSRNCYFAPLPGQTGPNPIRFNAQNNPFDTDSTFHLVDSTGRTTFTAKSTMEPILYYSAKKYRNNKFVNETYFLNQFSLMDDTRGTSFMKIDTAGLKGAVFNSQGTLMSCTGDTISFDADIILPLAPSSNANQLVRTTVDSTLPGNATCAINGLHSDTVHLKFHWVPPANAKGLYTAFVSAKDSSCSPPIQHYLQVYTWSFYIDSCMSPLGISYVTTSDAEGNIALYPNPSSSNVTITSGKEFTLIKVYNLLSELVMEKTMNSTREVQLDVSELASGIYLVNVDGVVRKMLVQRR